MRLHRFLAVFVFSIIGTGILFDPLPVRAEEIRAPASQVTAYELILAMNTLRVSYGLPALIEDPIVNAVAQSTAQTMAANNMSWHIGNVRGRIAAAGYGAYFPHGLGIDLPDLPMLAPRSPDVLQPGHITTVEPGVYLAGRGGVRIEDNVLVTESGHENLTTASKELVEL